MDRLMNKCLGKCNNFIVVNLHKSFGLSKKFCFICDIYRYTRLDNCKCCKSILYKEKELKEMNQSSSLTYQSKYDEWW